VFAGRSQEWDVLRRTPHERLPTKLQVSLRLLCAGRRANELFLFILFILFILRPNDFTDHELTSGFPGMEERRHGYPLSAILLPCRIVRETMSALDGGHSPPDKTGAQQVAPTFVSQPESPRPVSPLPYTGPDRQSLRRFLLFPVEASA